MTTIRPNQLPRTCRRPLLRRFAATLTCLLATAAAGLAQDRDQQQGPAGGSGTAFNLRVPAGMRIHRVEVRSGADVDNLRFYGVNLTGTQTWDSGWIGDGTGGGLNAFDIPAGDPLRAVTFWHNGTLLRGVQFATFGTTSPVYGVASGTQVTYTAPTVTLTTHLETHVLCGLVGRQGSQRIRALGILTRTIHESAKRIQRAPGNGVTFTNIVPDGEHVAAVELQVYSGIVVRLRCHYRSANGQITGIGEWSGPFTSFPATTHLFEIPLNDSLRKVRTSFSTGTVAPGEFVYGMTFETANGISQHYGYQPFYPGPSWDEATAPEGYEIVGFFGENKQGLGNAGIGIECRRLLHRRDAYGTGCGIGITPLLSTSSAVTPGALVSMRIDNIGANTPTLLLFGSGPVNVPIGPCQVLIANATPINSGITGTFGGSAVHPIQIPGDFSLLGADLYMQGFGLQPNGPFLGIGSLTNGYHIAVGAY